MFDLNSLPISGGVVVAGLVWAGVSGFVLGPVVADRTIEKTGWQRTCVRDLRATVAKRMPQEHVQPELSCEAVAGTVPGPLGALALDFCRNGGGELLDMLPPDPSARLREEARRRELARLARIAEQAPSRCSCAVSIVASERVTWGLYAGSARLVGGPHDLTSELDRALQAPRCALLGEE